MSGSWQILEIEKNQINLAHRIAMKLSIIIVLEMINMVMTNEGIYQLNEKPLIILAELNLFRK